MLLAAAAAAAVVLLYLLSAMKCQRQLTLLGYKLTGCYINSRSILEMVVPTPA
jgi:hypothetical protein